VNPVHCFSPHERHADCTTRAWTNPREELAVLMSKTTALLLPTLIVLHGCATKDYGQLPLLEATAAPTDCRQVGAQLEEMQQFTANIDRQSEFSAADVVAFLLDFGIGNAIAKDSAVKSAALRTAELTRKSDELNCSADRSKHVKAAVGRAEPPDALPTRR
jgi:hypothetical protein